MGNNLVCFENMCSENIYEINWITEKNWIIDYKYNNTKHPYLLNRGNFKITNNGYCFFKLLKKLDFEYDIEKILINIEFDFKLFNKNFLEVDFIVLNNLKQDVSNEKNIISKIKFNKNKIEINNETLKMNKIIYNLLLNFKYINYIVFNETIKKNDDLIYNNNNKINFENKNDIYFGIIIRSNIYENKNMDNYLNIKVL